MKQFAACLRYSAVQRGKDIALLQGAPMLGALFALDAPPSTEQWQAGLLLLIGSTLLVTHVFALNDWADAARDALSPRKAAVSFRQMGISDKGILRYSVLTGLLGLAVLSINGPVCLLLAAGVLGAGLVYSHPRFDAKAVPLVSSLCHFVGQTFQVLLGAACMGSLPSRVWWLVPFFGLVFVAGHLNQEVRDTEDDALAAVRTNAAAFGPHKALLASHAVFFLAFVYLLGLSTAGVLPMAAVFLGLAYPAYAAAFILTFRATSLHRRALVLRTVYRGLFLVVGTGLAGLWLAHLWF